ncbi:MAG: 3-oxoadipate enol-lactonase [Pseudomonadota bacterium]
MELRQINGHWLHVAVTGPADGRPVVLANSLGTDFRVWDRLMARFPAAWRVLRFDKRGHGLSELPSTPWTMEDLVGDAEALMEEAGMTGALFVGLSIGGLIAQGLAHRRPDLVRAMVLMDTAARIGNAGMWEERIATIEAGGIAALSDAVMERWFAHAFRTGRPGELAGWRAMLERTPAAGYIGCSRAIMGADYTATTAQLRLPVLAMAGDEDGSTPPALVAETAALIDGSRFELIENAGHLPCVEAPDVVARLIVEFEEETRG